MLARKLSKTQDSSENIHDEVGDQDKRDSSEKEKKENEPILSDNSKDGFRSENPRQIICKVRESVAAIDAIDTHEVIEQIDGNTESTVTYDQTISAGQVYTSY